MICSDGFLSVSLDYWNMKSLLRFSKRRTLNSHACHRHVSAGSRNEYCVHALLVCSFRAKARGMNPSSNLPEFGLPLAKMKILLGKALMGSLSRGVSPRLSNPEPV